mmetsp:Transcript_27446/g.57533  ORF Transcript_27446/g.57533 Transcript_27446/m.57533 type:complete len:200 (-) Transcript_27446:208-807(-)
MARAVAGIGTGRGFATTGTTTSRRPVSGTRGRFYLLHRDRINYRCLYRGGIGGSIGLGFGRCRFLFARRCATVVVVVGSNVFVWRCGRWRILLACCFGRLAVAVAVAIDVAVDVAAVVAVVLGRFRFLGRLFGCLDHLFRVLGLFFFQRRRRRCRCRSFRSGNLRFIGGQPSLLLLPRTRTRKNETASPYDVGVGAGST